MIRFGVVLFDGFDELDAIAPWEVLRSAAQFGAPFETTLFSLDGAPTVEASHGLKVAVEKADLATFDWIVVPGGSWLGRGPRGAWAEIQRGVLPNALRELRARGKSIASVCTGAMILSAAGITKGRSVTTHHVAREALKAEGALVIDARVVDDGDLVTAGGVTSGLDLALWLTERLASAEIARKVAANLEHQRVGGVHHGARSTEASENPIASSPEPPYYAVLFSSVRTDVAEGYDATAEQMVALAAQQPGYLGMESVREGSGFGITVSYWKDEASIRQWKQNTEHLLAQKTGREQWYRRFTTRVARVERAYGFEK